MATLGLAAMRDRCTPAESHPLPPRPRLVGVLMSEYEFTHRGQVSPGRAVVRLKNVGDVQHEAVVVRLPDDLQVGLDEELRAPDKRAVATIVHVGARPGETRVFALDLFPGRYGMICFVREADGTQHFERGMNSELTVLRR